MEAEPTPERWQSGRSSVQLGCCSWEGHQETKTHYLLAQGRPHLIFFFFPDKNLAGPEPHPEGSTSSWKTMMRVMNKHLQKGLRGLWLIHKLPQET